jgi:hypothetical protein
VIEERADHIIKESSKVQDTLSSIEMQTDNLAEASKHVGVQINDVLLHSKSIFEQSKEIATAQAELGRGQAEMREKIEAGMARVEESYQTLGNGMDKLKQETGYIHKEIQSVGASMSSKMQHLQSTADDIGSAAGKSLENQMQLLNGQAQAMDGLNELHSFQAQALEESRCYCYYVHMYRSFCNVFLNIDKMLAARLTVIKKKMLTKFFNGRETVQRLAQFGQRQQEELLSRQEEIRQAHEHLIQNSHSILEAQVLILPHFKNIRLTLYVFVSELFHSYTCTQEEFRAKQANIFAALDKLYILHNAILAESRFIKAFFFYCCIVFLVYMLTSAKQTFSIRGHLYFGTTIFTVEIENLFKN